MPKPFPLQVILNYAWGVFFPFVHGNISGFGKSFKLGKLVNDSVLPRFQDQA